MEDPKPPTDRKASPQKGIAGWPFKEFFSSIREGAVTLVLLVCLFSPSCIKQFLDQSGIDELTIFGVGVKRQKAEDELKKAQAETTQDVVSKADGPPVEATTQPVSPELKQAVVKAEQIAPDLLPGSGWVFLGQADASRTSWVAGSPTTIVKVPLDALLGQDVTVRDDVYLRADGNAGARAKSPITSVVTVGSRLRVVELDYSRARSGGFFVWAKVSVALRP